MKFTNVSSKFCFGAHLFIKQLLARALSFMCCSKQVANTSLVVRYIEKTVATTTIKEEPNIVFTAIPFVLLVLGRLFIGTVPFLPRHTLQMGLNFHANSYISCRARELRHHRQLGRDVCPTCDHPVKKLSTQQIQRLEILTNHALVGNRTIAASTFECFV